MLGSADRMPFRTCLILTSLLAVLVAGCGSGSSAPERTSASAPAAGNDVNSLLQTTFANLGKLHAATMDLKLDITPSGGSSGAVSAHLSGPFVSQGAGKMPKFDLTAQLTSAGKTVTAGASYTGEKGYLALQGNHYVVDDSLMAQLTTAYTQAQQKGQKQSGGLVLGALGVDFSKWLKNARNAGTAQVGDAQTTEVTGDANVPQVVDDLDKIAAKANALNIPGTSGQLPAKLTPQQKQAAIQAIKSFTVTVYTGTQDKILRRVVVAAEIADQGTTSKLAFDLTFTKVGQDQAIAAPKDAKPFSALQSAIQAAGLGSLGSLTGGATGSSGSASGSGANNVDKYAQCIEKANGDVAKGRKCAALLSG
jgi:hypothetical protein